MTPQEIRDAISADPALHALVPDTVAMSWYPVFSGYKSLTSKKIGTGTILAVFGDVGGHFIDLLVQIGETDRNIYWIFTGNIMRGDFDVGEQASQTGLANLVAAMPALVADESLRGKFIAGLTTLSALGYASSPVSEFDIRKAIFADDGSLLV